MIQKKQPKSQNAQNLKSGHSGTGKAPAATFSSHVGELRRRILLVALAFVIASGLAYNYHDFFVALIMRPLGTEKLIYLTPGGGVNFIFQVSLYAGLVAAAPVFIYQLYGFIRPALPLRARRSAVKVVSAAVLLMLCGVGYGYFVAVPSALHFLSTFAGDAVTPSLTADSYLSFFLAYIAGLGVLFELPLLLLFLHWIHPMTPGGVVKSERYVILLAFVVAAIITPTPDVFNQAMIALPLIFIYQLGVVAVLAAIRKERRAAKPRARETPELHTPPATAEKTPKPAPAGAVAATPRRPRQKTVDGFGRRAAMKRTAKTG